MISVQKPAECPQSLQKTKCLQYVLEICRQQGRITIHNRHYSHRSIKDALKGIYGHKCAYCEGDLNITGYPEVEHFRPKGSVREDRNHGGYYWLAHEWSNLLLVCRRCNNAKSNRFPLKDESTRCEGQPELNGGKLCSDWINPHTGQLNREERLLLNPEWDEVEKQFYFTPDGEIHSDTDQGVKSIEVYGLNRDALVFSRKKISEHYSRRIVSQVGIFMNDLQEIKDKGAGHPDDAFDRFCVQIRDILDEMHAAIHPMKTFLAYRVHMTVLSFEKFIIRGLPTSCRDFVRQIVHEYQPSIE